ncbi:hypothetical protein C8J56DRAFT_483548 [Mycena floridula]|nr:hypothetical protein C8J56DRAFT_483548 [Mycena floridula]
MLRFSAHTGHVFASRILRWKTPPARTIWLEYLLQVAHLLQNATELLPFPFIKAGASVVVDILETIKTVQNNRDDFRDLLTSIVDIVKTIRDEILLPGTGRILPARFSEQCTAFNDHLIDILGELHHNSRSTRAWKRYVLSNVIQSDIARYRKRVEEIRANFMLCTVIQNQLILHQVQNGIHDLRDDISRLPLTLGYTWERSSDRPIWLVDMMDVKTPLPVEFCQSWERFFDLLVFMHKDRPGGQHISLGDFEVSTNDNEHLVRSASWNSLVKPGSTLKMSALLRLLEDDSRRCPGCSMIFNTALSLGSETRCPNCGTTFRVSRGFIDDAPDDSPGPQTAATTSPNPSQLESKDDDTRYFRRFHVVLPAETQDNIDHTLPKSNVADLLPSDDSFEFDSFSNALPPRLAQPVDWNQLRITKTERSASTASDADFFSCDSSICSEISEVAAKRGKGRPKESRNTEAGSLIMVSIPEDEEDEE